MPKFSDVQANDSRGRRTVLLQARLVLLILEAFENDAHSHGPQLIGLAMEGGEGMVAVVRGLRDAGLAVTLLDGNREFTLMPNSLLHPAAAPNKDVTTYRTAKPQPTQNNSIGTEIAKDYLFRDTGAQVSDGRYASVYKVAHCHVKPSSPPQELTEFPPQRVELCPGHGNFEVGGAGSGESYVPIKANGKFRGGMSWPERGAVCSPRVSRETDTFANSLRKYPCMSPDRSSEIIERLINYSQSRSSKTYNIRNQSSPQRSPDYSSSNHIVRSPRNCTPKTPQRCDPATRDKPRVDESPTRDRPKNASRELTDSKKVVSCRNYEVKCIRDTYKRKDTRLVSTYPYNQPSCPPIKESYDHLPPRPRGFTDQFSNNSVNMEIQAAVRMVSKEVATTPRAEPGRRTVAVPLSPTPSNANRTSEGECTLLENTKSTQKSFCLKRKSVQTVSFTDITNSDNDFNIKDSRRIKSQEELKITNEYFKTKVSALFENVSYDDRMKKVFKDFKIKHMRRRCKCESVHTPYNRCINSISMVAPPSYRDYHEEIVEYDRGYTSYDNTIHVYRAEVTPFNINENIEFAVNNWVNGLPINSRDFISELDRNDILNNMAFRLKELIINKFKNEITNLKSDILDLIGDIPINLNINSNKSRCLNKLVDGLLERIRNTLGNQNNERNKSNGANSTSFAYKTRKHMRPNKIILKEFIRKQVHDSFDKLNVIIAENEMHVIENELADIFVNSLKFGNYRDIEHQIKYILTEIGNLDNDKVDYLINVLLQIFKEVTLSSSYSQIFSVYQSTMQNSRAVNESSDFTIGELTQGDLMANLDSYVNQLCDQIEDWLENLNINQVQDSGFRQVVVHDLAGDIVDRHKYLEMNPSSRGSDDEELEQLKYQIFKWINKLVGEHNTETIQHAEELMAKIKSVPVPMLVINPRDTKPVYSQNNTCPSTKCQNSVSNKCNDSKFVSLDNNGMEADRKINTPGEMPSNVHALHRSVSSSVQSKGSDSPRIISNVPSTSNPTVVSQKSKLGPDISEGNMWEARQRETYQRLSSSIDSSKAISGQSMYLPSDKLENLKLNNSMPSGGLGNRNIKGMSSPSAISSKHDTRNPSDLLAFGSASLDGRLIDTGEKTFIDTRLSGPAAMTSNQLCSENLYSETVSKKNDGQASLKTLNNCTNTILSRDISGPQSIPCCPKQDTISMSIKRLNEEFDEFLKQWVQEIPIIVSKPEEQSLAEKARLGLYNGIWKAITKLKFEPSIFNNRFYYQDVLDDEIEDLLNILPKTPELESKKHALKAKLLEKTTDTNEQILNLAVTATYKQQLIENIENTLPTFDKTNENLAKLNEELQKLCLAEDYILYIRYKDDDIVKANVYRKKLLQNVEKFIENIKKTHGKELQDIDPALYMDEIVNALNKVPIPETNTINEEADEILLGLEIEQWFSDLPVVENLDFNVQLQRRYLRDKLAKKIHNIEKERNLSDCVASKELGENIVKFLGKIPLENGTDIAFVTDELINRLKNRPRNRVRKKSVAFQEPHDYLEFKSNMQCCSIMGSVQNASLNSIRRRSVGFQEPQGYEEFSKNMPCCSSFTGHPSNILSDSAPKSWIDGQSPIGKEELSLEESRLPHSMVSNSQTKRTIPRHSLSYSQAAFPSSLQGSAANYSYPNAQLYQSPQRHQQYSNETQLKQNDGSGICCGRPRCRNTIDHTGFQNSIPGPSPSSEIAKNPHLHPMAGGGYGILGTSQIAGSSGLQSSKTTSTQPCGGKCSTSGNTFYKSTDGQGRQEAIQNRSMQQQNVSREITSPCNTPESGNGVSGQSVGYYREVSPQRSRKNYRQVPSLMDGVRRKLDMKDTESEGENERDDYCRCVERYRRCRGRRPVVVSCDDYDIPCPQFVPLRCPYAYFF